jgi:hypothetical protein
MGWFMEKDSILWTVIVELVVAPVQDIHFLPGAVVYLFEAAHFAHLGTG